MPGIGQICKEINARCPHCHRAIDLTDFGREVFRRIVADLSEGKRVEVEGLGTFRAPVAPARKVAGLKSQVSVTRAKRIIRFRASKVAKERVNKLFEQEAKTRSKKK